MRYRDKVSKSALDPSCKGGVAGCPEMYDLPENPECPMNRGLIPSDSDCTKCWDRPIKQELHK